MNTKINVLFKTATEAIVIQKNASGPGTNTFIAMNTVTKADKSHKQRSQFRFSYKSI